MSDIEHPDIYSIIKNAVGFYYIYATDPARVEVNEEGVRSTEFNDGDNEVVEIIASAVYTHLLEMGLLNV